HRDLRLGRANLRQAPDQLAGCPARRVWLPRRGRVDDLPGRKMPRCLDREALEQRSREREVADGDDADLLLPCDGADLLVVLGREPGAADDHVPPGSRRRQRMRLGAFRPSELDEDLEFRPERLVDRAAGDDPGDALPRPASRDPGDQLEVVGPLDGLSEGSTDPARDTGDAYARHADTITGAPPGIRTGTRPSGPRA